MRKIFKPENIRKDIRVVRIPDIEFQVQKDEDEAEAEKNEEIRIQELYDKALVEIRDEYSGEIGRKKLVAQQECGRLVQNAKKEAEKILEDAKVQSETLIAEANAATEKIKQDAYNEGYAKGIAEKSELLENLSEKISQSIEIMKADEQSYFDNYTQELKTLAFEIAEKVISQKIEEDDMLMYNVIKDAVKSVRDAKWIKVSVSDQLSGYVDSLEKELKDSGANSEFIISDGSPKDTCVLNTSNGLVVATLSTQLANMKEYILKLDKGEGNEEQS